VAGGISAIVARIQDQFDSDAEVFLTGGNAGLLRPLLNFDATSVEHLVLEGIVIASRRCQWAESS
jgi:pantothenate kinase type III